MKVAVITDDRMKEELLAQGIQEGVEVAWLTEPVVVDGAAAYIDLLFTGDANRIAKLEQLQTGTVIINYVAGTLNDLPGNFVRFNGWHSFLKRNIAEAACDNEAVKGSAAEIFACFGRSVEWVPDSPGFIAARVVSMIINEAYLVLEEAVSSKEEIDTAMKLGTNYPYGPFEWGGVIGLANVHSLLMKLAETDPRYNPSALLQQEVLAL